MDSIKEECRDSRGIAGWEQLKQDVSFGVRLLLKNRTFSCIALATMAAGIGSTTAVFSLIDGILIRPLPFAAPERLFHADDIGMRGPFDTLRANSRLPIAVCGPSAHAAGASKAGVGEFLPG
jgi:hypothetical protein